MPDADLARLRDEHLFIYSIVRADLEMPTGKLSSQAGHGYTESLCECLEQRPDSFWRYRRKENAGSKATLIAKNEAALLKTAALLRDAGIPHALFYDEGHVMLPHFDGSEVLTALGIGPVSRKEARPFVKSYQLVK